MRGTAIRMVGWFCCCQLRGHLTDGPRPQTPDSPAIHRARGTTHSNSGEDALRFPQRTRRSSRSTLRFLSPPTPTLTQSCRQRTGEILSYDHVTHGKRDDGLIQADIPIINTGQGWADCGTCDREWPRWAITDDFQSVFLPFRELQNAVRNKARTASGKHKLKFSFQF